MSTVDLLIICVTVLALAALLASTVSDRSDQVEVSAERDDSFDLPLETDVLLHLLSGAEIRGRVIATGNVHELADAHLTVAGGASPMGGLARVRADRVDWAQVL